MKHYLLSLLLLVPYLLAAQEQTEVLGITLVYTNSSIPETASGMAKTDGFFRNQLPESWGHIPTNENPYLRQLSQTGLRLGINLHLGSKKENPRFTKHLDLGISLSDRYGSDYYNYYDTVIATNAYPTPLGTLYEDTVFAQSHYLDHYTGILAIDAQLRVYTSNEHWFKAYAGSRVLLGLAVNSGVQGREHSEYRTETRLENQSIHPGDPLDDYPHHNNYENFQGPQYTELRLGIPAGMEARFGKPGVDAGQLTLVLEGELGTELTTGPMGYLTLYTAINLGIRYYL